MFVPTETAKIHNVAAGSVRCQNDNELAELRLSLMEGAQRRCIPCLECQHEGRCLPGAGLGDKLHLRSVPPPDEAQEEEEYNQGQE